MLREIIETRLELLESQKVICEKAATSGRMALNVLLEKYPKIKEEKAIAFLTHFVMAVQRMECGEKEPMRLDPWIYKEVQNTDSYSQAVELLDRITGQLREKFSECEKEFLLVHLCSLLEP